MKVLNIYGQPYWHADARIIGNREGLLDLRDAINRALRSTPPDYADRTGEALFASDGEGYTVMVEIHDDEWGIAGGKQSFWNTEASWPEYTSIEGG